MRYCGREFSAQEMELIRSIIAEDPSRHRLAISRVVCERLDWRRLNGELKDMSCRVAMLRMHRDGLIRLPAPQRVCYNGRRRRRRTPPGRTAAADYWQRAGTARMVSAPGHRAGRLTVVVRIRGPLPLPGLHPAGGSPAALSGDQRAAGVSRPGLCRLRLEGRSPRSVHRLEPGSTRGPLTPIVVNNARFLILPWVQVKNLASCLLARSCRRLPGDWLARYGYRPLLLETFVQSDRFAGTCYRAANWINVGQTQGRGKLDVHNQRALPKKDIWLYPLQRDFRRRLCAPLNPHPNP